MNAPDDSRGESLVQALERELADERAEVELKQACIEGLAQQLDATTRRVATLTQSLTLIDYELSRMYHALVPLGMENDFRLARARAVSSSALALACPDEDGE